MDKGHHIETIQEAHSVLGLKDPDHPLVSVIYNDEINLEKKIQGVPISLGMFFISFQIDNHGIFKYQKKAYDFNENSILFVQAGQILSYKRDVNNLKTNPVSKTKAWTLLFHPDLIRNFELSQKIGAYLFFSYNSSVALHISDAERESLGKIISKIKDESKLICDKYSDSLIVSNIEELLNYCARYYDEQFESQSDSRIDILDRFENLLKNYYSKELQQKLGIPTVQYCGQELNISHKYLSDLLKKKTGKSAKIHIDYFLINIAKDKLVNSSKSISQIAFFLGFKYSQHFAKMFKAKTGMSPISYRNMN